MSTQQRRRCTTKQIEAHLRATCARTLGDIERLAGINTLNERERHDLWFGFRHLFPEPHDAVWAAVKGECLRRTAAMVTAGTLSLWPRMEGGTA